MTPWRRGRSLAGAAAAAPEAAQGMTFVTLACPSWSGMLEDRPTEGVAMPASRLHPIPKRDLQFDFSKVDLGNWHGHGPHVSHYFNVQSLLFPQGERFFIRSVRHYRDQIQDPVLQEQVAGFIAQEAMHGREHEAYNAALGRIGYPVKWMERRVAFSLWMAEKLSGPKDRLAMTAALEHLTAIGAEDALADDRIFEGADPEMARLWRWHAMEETEHKAVAFDVFMEVTKHWSPLARYRRRLMIMMIVTRNFTRNIARHAAQLLEAEGYTPKQAKRAVRRFMWFKPGLLRMGWRSYFAWYRPGFHPWDLDNRAELAGWKAEFDEAAAALKAA
jgi:uncharacterized protein